MNRSDLLRKEINESKHLGLPPEVWRHKEIALAEALIHENKTVVVITEICSMCQGSGVLGEHNTDKQHECPWCNSTGNVLKEVNDVIERLNKVKPGITIRFCNVFGNGNRVERKKPRLA
jgi:DnaJ-class molecular chaperone